MVKEYLKSLKDIFNTEDVESSNSSSTTGTSHQGVRFHINSKEPKSVDILLQRMFSKEFDITQDDLLTSTNN